MNSPDDFNDLERRLSQAFQSHAESIEPSPDAYSRLARAVDAADGGGGGISRLLGWGSGRGQMSGLAAHGWRPVAFVAAVLAVAGFGGYGLLTQISSPSETATAAPANADASDFVSPADEADRESDPAEPEALESADESGPTGDRMADSAEQAATSSVPSNPAAAGSASSSASDPVEEFAGLTYSPVRVTVVEAAEAFLRLIDIENLLDIDDTALEEDGDQVVVRSTNGSVLTTLTIGAIGDGFMVVDARSDTIGLTVANAERRDLVDDEIEDGSVVEGPIELVGNTAAAGVGLEVGLRSVVDGSLLQQEVVPGPVVAADGRFQLTIPAVGAERVWVVAQGVDPATGDRALAARSLLYLGEADPQRYTVVGLRPDDPDGGLVVRRTPNGPRLGVLPPGSTGVERRLVPPRTVDGLTWWAVTDGNGLEGWVAARYLAVDETPAETTMIELARTMIAAAETGDMAPVESLRLARPIFLGPIVDPQPVQGFVDVESLLNGKRRIPGLESGGVETLEGLYGYGRWSEAEVFVPRSYQQAGAEETAHAFFGDLPSVVIRSLNPETGGWERVHIFVTRDGENAVVVGMVVEQEPIPEDAGNTDGLTNATPSAAEDGGQ